MSQPKQLTIKDGHFFVGDIELEHVTKYEITNVEDHFATLIIRLTINSGITLDQSDNYLCGDSDKNIKRHRPNFIRRLFRFLPNRIRSNVG